MTKFITLITAFFPVWLCISVGFGLWNPEVFSSIKGSVISDLLALIMLSMGMTLKSEDFTRVLSRPIPVVTGVVLQYTIMPLSGYLIARGLNLDPSTSAGLILVSTCPGGTASNVLTFIAKADVALSVTMTVFSTLLAVIFTPLLATFLIGSTVEFSSVGLFESTFTSTKLAKLSA